MNLLNNETSHSHCHCQIIPPHIQEKVASANAELLQELASYALEHMKAWREHRHSDSFTASIMHENIYDGNHDVVRVYDTKNTENLPGTLVRANDNDDYNAPSDDIEVNEAYEYAQATQAFYLKFFGRDSIDGKGMPINSTVHYGKDFDNAFWNGEQMVYGDGDGKVFKRFTIAPDVIGHELTHGVTQYRRNLKYIFQSGALNESMSDCFGIMIKQMINNQTADESDWLIGEGLLYDINNQKYALRSMKDPGTAYIDHPVLGTDPQPATMADYDKLKFKDDNGGVHINSGIPNHAFYLVSTKLGGFAWEKAGKIWYDALPLIHQISKFEEFADATISAANKRFGRDSAEEKAVMEAWREVDVIK